MYPLISFTCAVGVGLWAGGLMNLMSRKYAPVGTGTGETFAALPARLLSSLIFGLLVISVELSLEWFIALPFVAVLVTISITDIRHKIIPDIVILPSIVVIALLRIWIHTIPYWEYLASGLILGGFFYLIALFAQLFGKTDVIGGGDIKLLVLTGVVLGLKLSLLFFLLLSLAGTILGIVIILTGRYKYDLVLPFGPIIAGSAIISYFWGADFIAWTVGMLLF